VTFWDRWGSYHHAIFSEQINIFSHTAQSALTALQHASLPAIAVINHALTQQAMTRSNDDIMVVSSYAFVGLIVLIWFAKPPFMSNKPKR
ncbi:MAG: MFS transporter, partial [Epsilonproteobacteria bacterium]|nr:MFS transporter [Campylobacterota bacterium]